MSVEINKGNSLFFYLDYDSTNYNKCMSVVVEEILNLKFMNMLVSKEDLYLIKANSNAVKHFEKFTYFY